ncbi:MAG: DNA recombination protein RmuC [Pseudoalteromonas tetraodonis]|jgi:DNA recombination protein RmuC
MNLDQLATLTGYPVSLIAAVSLCLLVVAMAFGRWIGVRRGQSLSAPLLAQLQEREIQLREQLQQSGVQIASARSELSELRNLYTVAQRDVASLQATLKAETRLAGEQAKTLLQAQETLKVEFQNTANKLLDEKSKHFAELNQKEISGLLNPLREQISRFEKQVDDRYSAESKERFSLVNEISSLKELNQQLGQEANNLTTALVGQSKAQGTWGELVLEQVLEKSGLELGREYDREVSLKNSEGKTYRPDVIVHLPGDREVIIDSKVSLVAYERYANADNDVARAAALKEHLQSVRNHVKELSNKNYPDLLNGKTLDFVFMFVPIESAFIEAVRNDVSLYDDAFKANIGLVAPSTLLGMLRTIHNLWQNDKQNKNALEIARKAGSLYDKFVAFVADIDKVGEQLDKTQDVWKEARNKLTDGRGNLVRTSQQIKQLGAKASKSLPDSALDELDVNDD